MDIVSLDKSFEHISYSSLGIKENADYFTDIFIFLKYNAQIISLLAKRKSVEGMLGNLGAREVVTVI